MKVDGRQIADKVYKDLQTRVGELKKQNFIPQLTVILVGDNPASVSYVKQKQKWGEYIGAKITILNYPTSVSTEELINKITQLNADPTNHAILIQRPLPTQIDERQIIATVNPQKDIDGFHPNSPYTLPLPLAVVKILEYCHSELAPAEFDSVSESTLKKSENINSDFLFWLKSQKTVILGKGPTGGGPILKYLNKLGINPTQIDSKTINIELLKNADIIISAVGKPNIITAEKIKKGAILIGVGIFRGKNGKLQGDYDEGSIEDTAGYYTPTPGGVGPVNVAMLMVNLLNSTIKQIKS